MKHCPHCGGALPRRASLPLRRTPLERAKAGLRDMGFSVKGNSNPYIGYDLASPREGHHLAGEEALIAFARKRGVEV